MNKDMMRNIIAAVCLILAGGAAAREAFRLGDIKTVVYDDSFLDVKPGTKGVRPHIWG